MKLSIITINFNNAAGLRSTANSIANQSTREFEWIVIDGGSTDGSVDVIKKYSNYVTFWCSEKDAGIYNAMNKGVAHANGIYCNFMNSGDIFANRNVIEFFNNYNSDSDVLLGGHSFFPSGVRSDYKRPRVFTASYIIGATISHQASFIKTDLLRRYPYDESLKIVSDWKFFLTVLVMHGHRISYLPFDVAKQDAYGVSLQRKELALEERNKVLKEFLPEMVVKDLNVLSGCDYEAMQFMKEISKNPRIKKMC